MAVVVTSGNVGFSTAGGFTRGEAYNIGKFNTQTALSDVTPKTIPVTFLNACNIKGIILAFAGNRSYATPGRSITVELQQYIASVWTVVATKTLTYAQITNNEALNTMGTWITEFEFASPYTVTTAASTWRFNMYAVTASGTYNDLGWYSTDGTNPIFVAYDDTSATYSDTNDTFVVRSQDTLIIDQSVHAKPITGTGDTTIGCSGLLCKSLNPLNPYKLIWKADPSTSFTWTSDGLIQFGSHAGPAIATPLLFTAPLAVGATSATLYSNWTFSTTTYECVFGSGERRTVTLTNGATTCTWSTPLTLAAEQMAGIAVQYAHKAIIITSRTNTAGSSNLSGFWSVGQNSQGIWAYDIKCSVMVLGSIPTKTYTTLTSSINLSATSVPVTDASWLNIGDWIIPGRANMATGDYGWMQYQISNIVGNTITLASGILGYAGIMHYNGGVVVRTKHVTNGSYYGVEMRNSNDGAYLNGICATGNDNFWVDGVYCQQTTMSGQSGSRQSLEDPIWTSQFKFRNILFNAQYDLLAASAHGGSSQSLVASTTPPPKGLIYENCIGIYASVTASHVCLAQTWGSSNQYVYASGTCYYNNIVGLGGYGGAIICPPTNTAPPTMILNGLIYNNSYDGPALVGANSVWENVEVWGGRGPNLYIGGTGGSFNSSITNVTTDIGAQGLYFPQGSSVKTKVNNISYGQIRPNTIDVYTIANAYIDTEIAGSTGTPVFNTGTQQLLIPGSDLRQTNTNGVTNNDSNMLQWGNIVRTGT